MSDDDLGKIVQTQEEIRKALQSLGTSHNHRVWKIVSGIISGLLLLAIVGMLRMGTQIENLRTTQENMSGDVAENAQWIHDWDAVKKVPERDQKQDDNIDELQRDADELRDRMVEFERRVGALERGSE